MTLQKGSLSAVIAHQLHLLSFRSLTAVADLSRQSFDLVQCCPRDCLTCGLAKYFKCTEERMIGATLRFWEMSQVIRVRCSR